MPRRKCELPATSNSNSAFVDWPPVTTRYLKVRVNDSYQKRYPGPWMFEAQIPWSRKLGLPTAGDGRNLNVQIAEITCYDARPADYPVPNPPDVTFPRHRLQRDWLYQDVGLDVARVFTSDRDANSENAMLQKVLEQVPDEDPAVNVLRQRLERLVGEKAPGCDPGWRSLYLDACAARRKARLEAVRARATQFIYAKHFVFGCMQGLVGKYDIPDEQIRDYTPAFKRGGQLCMGTLLEDGTVLHEVLIEKPEGAICYPNLSWDARTLVFFCNAVDPPYGTGRSCFVGHDGWGKGSRPQAGIPGPGPYHGLLPGVFRPGESIDRGCLGEDEQALVIADIDTQFSVEGKPRPQMLPAPLQLVAHLPLLETWEATRHNESDEPRRGCRCQNSCEWTWSTVQDATAESSNKELNWVAHVLGAIGSSRAPSQATGNVPIASYLTTVDHPNRARLADSLRLLAAVFKHSRWMQGRAKRFAEEHAANPQLWPPPAAVDWLLVDLGPVNNVSWPTIEVPPYANLEGDYRAES